jgi:hypothetical protein
MRERALFITVFVFLAVVCSAAQIHPVPVEVKTYELYSWQDAKGTWTFGLFPAVSNAGLHPDYIMRPSNALTGPARLKQVIIKLPGGSEILWLDHAVGMWKEAEGWKRIKFPPADVISDIRRFCVKKGTSF